MVKKGFLVTLIVVGVIGTYVIMTAAMPAIRDLIAIAAADPSAGNYSGYLEAVTAAPWWLYFIPAIVGGISVIMVLRTKEPHERRWQQR